MPRRVEWWLAVAVVAALVVAAVAGSHNAPGTDLDDPRASTLRSGPNGAKALAETLRRVGVHVRQSRRPLFDLGRATSRPGDIHSVQAFLDIELPPEEELGAVREFVARGGAVFVAGYTGIERCFGFASRYIGSDRWETLDEPVAVRAPADAPMLPPSRRYMDKLPAESLGLDRGGDGPVVARRAPACPLLGSSSQRVLLSTVDGRPVAVALEFPRGGRATLVADVVYVTNRSLRETDAGILVIPWLLKGGVRRVVFDELHQGFGAERTVWSLAGAALRWLAGQPLGWAVLQLFAVGLLALAMMSIRFGPARAGVESRRRSPGEHVEALAAGLEGAGGDDAAIDLVVGGLRRRLRGAGRTPGGDLDWIRALERAMPDDRGKRAAARLHEIVERHGGAGGVLAAAETVEDVWEHLSPRTRRG